MVGGNQRNPNERAKHERDRAIQDSNIEVGTVVEAPDVIGPNEDVTRQSVRVKVGRGDKDEAEIAVYPVTSLGDVHPLTEGTTVLLSERKGDVLYIEGVQYTEAVGKTAKKGERRIGHELSDAEVFLRADGGVTVRSDDGTTITLSDGTITLNGGSQGVITDVTTTTDADGHVTSISLDRNTNILI